MKQYVWWQVLLLSMVTCGIYQLFVWADLSKNVNAADSSETDLMNSWLALLVLTPVTCSIFGIIWMFKYNKKLVAVAQSKGVSPAPSESPVVLLLLTFVPVYSFYVLCDNYNRIIAE